MIVVGAKGFAKEILQVLSVDLNIKDIDIFFFDNISKDLMAKLFNRFEILRTFDEVKSTLLKVEDNSFVLGVGSPKLRQKMFKMFVNLGAIPKTVISNNAEIGSFDVVIGKATAIMSGTVITNSVNIGNGCLINLNCTIGHDCIIGDFIELSPSVNVSGRCQIGDFTTIGTSAVILPDIIIGKNVTIGAGSVITKDIPDNAVVVGVPGKIIKYKE